MEVKKRIELDVDKDLPMIKNKEEIFNLTPEQLNNMQPGSYLIVDGQLVPNMKDEAMRKRIQKSEDLKKENENI